MTTAFRHYLIGQAIGFSAFNAICNATYTWLLWRANDTITLNGDGAVGADLAMTPIWIALLSTLLGTAFIRSKIADGRMIRDSDVRAPCFARYLPRNIVFRAIALGGSAGLLFSLPLMYLLPLGGDGVLSLGDAIGTKLVLTVAFSLFIVPLVIFITLADVERQNFV